MINFKSRIENLQNKPDGGKLTATLVSVMKEMGWTIQDLNNCPIPSYMVIIDELNKEAKRQQSKLKKPKRGRR